MDGVNLHIYQSTFRHESRMLKITRSLARHAVFDQFVILARWEPGLARSEQFDAQRTVHRLATLNWPLPGKLGTVLALLEWSLRILALATRWNVACVNCHSLVVLPLCVALKYLKGCRLVYDTHELETETASLGGIRKWLSQRLERLLIGQADAIVVVGETIGDWYRQTYGREDVYVVRNVPEARPPAAGDRLLLRESLQIPAGGLLFLYQGVIDAGRGVEPLLEAFADSPPDCHLVFLGYGGLAERVQQEASRRANIHFHEAVPPERLADYTIGADVGLAVIENVSLSYYYCLPNKLFEYLQCGVPALVSDFPEMGRFVEQEGCGWRVAATAEAIRQAVTHLSREEIARKRAACETARARHCWQQEEQKLLDVYRPWRARQASASQLEKVEQTATVTGLTPRRRAG